MEPGKDEGKSAKADGQAVKRTIFFFPPTQKEPDGADKESACRCRRHRDTGSIPGSGRSPGGGNGNPVQYSCLGNPMDRGAWRAIVHGVPKSWTRLSTYTQLCRHPAPPPAAHEPETVLVGCELDPINIPQRLNYLVFTTPPHL